MTKRSIAAHTSTPVPRGVSGPVGMPEDLGRRLAQIYEMILRVAAEEHTADGGKFGDEAPSAAGCAPAERLEAR